MKKKTTIKMMGSAMALCGAMMVSQSAVAEYGMFCGQVWNNTGYVHDLSKKKMKRVVLSYASEALPLHMSKYTQLTEGLTKALIENQTSQFDFSNACEYAISSLINK